MEGQIIRGALSAREEFFYPDMDLGALPSSLRLVTARNGRASFQLLLEAEEADLPICLEAPGFSVEYFSMLDVPVEYNTGDGSEQGGAMVLERRPTEKPAYATRLAPFRVYDCLRPLDQPCSSARAGRHALYVCLSPRPETPAGTYKLDFQLGAYHCRLELQVYDVEIPLDQFPVTNWFSVDAICRFHQVERGSQAFYDMLRRYAQTMRRLHQTLFYIELDQTCVQTRNPYTFDFEYLRPMIEIFFEEGMQKLELGALLSRGFLPDGRPDMYTDRFTCAMAPELPFESLEGYALSLAFVQSLAAFLKKYGWEERLVFHIHDEPDIHYKDEATLEARKRQYYLAASILRKHIPGVQIIEAVASPAFRGGVDIWVPGTPGYEENKASFDQYTELGESVWTYVCCGPEGQWLNRFLDFALIKGRLLFWGCAANGLGGFLHWGFNQFPADMDPFQGTSCPNHTGIGTNFPCGDSFLVYPGSDGPWPGMRLEAARRGAEDACLLALLRARDPELSTSLVAAVFQDNTHYNADCDFFQKTYEQLLRALEPQTV